MRAAPSARFGAIPICSAAGSTSWRIDLGSSDGAKRRIATVVSSRPKTKNKPASGTTRASSPETERKPLTSTSA